MRLASHALISAVMSLGVLLAGCATPDSRQEVQQQLRGAETTLSNFQNDPNMTWFRNNLKNARAVVIAPLVGRGGFIVGGSGGDAVLLARDSATGGWTGPAFYNMGSASVGLLIGGDVSEIVILVMTEKALDGLLSKNVKLGADASVAAGPVGTGAGSSVTTDMVSFARSKGAYAGLSLDGTVIAPDTDANSAYYGQAVSPADILVRRTVNNPASASLQQALSRAAK